MWQLRTPDVPNDHSDRAYDEALVVRLIEIHIELLNLLSEFAFCLNRFANYRGRFQSALMRLESGDGRAFVDPMSDSYHDIWMELHQDLIVTLGLSREDLNA
jgi:hypothetical protein